MYKQGGLSQLLSSYGSGESDNSSSENEDLEAKHHSIDESIQGTTNEGKTGGDRSDLLER